MLKGLVSVCDKSQKSFFEYSEITESLSIVLEKSPVQTQRIIKKSLVDWGFVNLDSSQGQKKQKVLVFLKKAKAELDLLQSEVES